MHSPQIRNSLVLATWLLFFLPSVLAEPTAKTIGQIQNNKLPDLQSMPPCHNKK